MRNSFQEGPQLAPDKPIYPSARRSMVNPEPLADGPQL